MMAAARSIPVSRQLVSRYLAFGLAGLFVCLVSALILAARGSLFDLVSLVALGPLLLLLLGAIVLHQTVRLYSRIEVDLLRLSQDGTATFADIRPLRGDEPAVWGWNALVERLATQESLKSLESRVVQAMDQRKDQQLLDVFNSLTDAIVVTDSVGRIVLANKALFAIADLPSEEELTRQDLFSTLRIAQAINGEDVRQAFAQMSGHVVMELQRTNRIEDGVWRISRSPLRSGDRESQQLWTVRDITQQALVNQSRNEFVSTATHELRTPLANIMAYAETLVGHDKIDVEQQKEFCNVICSEAARLSRFVDDVLNVSQIESGAFRIDRRETDLERLLMQVIEHVRPQMVGKQIDFTVKLPPKLPKVHADRDKFHAALVNLLGNAAKYTPEGGAVHFEVESLPTQIVFHVQDNGFGISESDLPRVFEKFYRSRDERVSQLSGNGLGLAFTHEVIRLHGGRINVDSQINEGSRFTVTLPL